jgi:hypothetical protein
VAFTSAGFGVCDTAAEAACASFRHSAGQLNAVVRQQLEANGTIGPEGHSLRVLVQRQHVTGAERPRAVAMRSTTSSAGDLSRSAMLHNEYVR